MEESIYGLLTHNVKTLFIGRTIYYYDSLESTMDKSRELARQGSIPGTIVIAEKQTGGRGRLKRAWLSPKGNLSMSVILNPTIEKMHQLIMMSSVAVVRAIKSVCFLESQIKWPNDVMINGKKVSGILIENEIKENAIKFSIVGIGVNINFVPSDFPAMSQIATSLSKETCREISRVKLILGIIEELEQIYTNNETEVYQEWKRHMISLGKSIRVQSGESIESGIAEDVTETGNLLLRKHDGTLLVVTVGDVTIVKE